MKKFITFLGLLTFLSLTVNAQAMPGLQTGDKAPDFNARLHNGGKVQLSEVYKQNPVVLVFYRGAWCPYCNVHLQQFQGKYDEFKKEGAVILAISVDRTEKGKSIVQKNSLSFDVVSNPNGKILKDYGLEFNVPANLMKVYKEKYNIDLKAHSGRSDGLIAVSATYVIDSAGIIRYAFADEDYKNRAPVDEVLKAVQSL